MRRKSKARVIYDELTEAIVENGGVECEELPDVFFIDQGDPNSVYKIRVAKEICSRCPLRLLCLDYALAAGERDGIWGGASVPERKAMRRRGLVA